MERWTLGSEDDIDAAIGSRVLEETHYLECKREVGGNKELARDLAQFALDSGSLLIGVEEDKATNTWQRYPVPLNGLPERIEQVAQHAIDPPLVVIPRAIPSKDDPSIGYVFVEVPASPVAPHMVEGTYFGRGEKTRIRLSDAEVIRHHTSRASAESIGERLLREEVRREPIPDASRELGHMYLVAQPLTAPPEIATRFVRAEGGELFQLMVGVPDRILGTVHDYAPTPGGSATNRSRRAAGTAWCSGDLVAGRSWAPEKAGFGGESTMIDVEFREDGGLRVLVGRMTDEWAVQGRQTRVICDGVAVAYSLRLIAWASALGEKVGYRGSWSLGIYGDRLRGLRSAIAVERQWSEAQPYDADDYRAITRAAHPEMTERPHAVAERLVGRLVRGLGTWQTYGSLLSTEDSPS
jgi:hypothetical protein